MAFITQKTTRSVLQRTQKKKQSCKLLVADLEDTDPAARRNAARALIHCSDATTKLLSRLKREENSSVREVILGSLIHISDPSVVSELIMCLRTGTAATCNEIIDAMKQMTCEVAPVMRSLLADPDPDMRIFAVNILESLRHPNVESWLIEVIEADTHVNVCATAVDLLSEVGTTVAMEPLLRLKARFADIPYIQFAADVALQRIRGV
jgi:HEAT repeat protein